VPLSGIGYEEVFGTEIQWIYITGGTFNMGDTFGDGHNEEYPVHSVTLSDFYLAKTEVTVAQYSAFCRATGYSTPPLPSRDKDSFPIANVSWNDALAFCQWAGCRLPTEAEWEYAARSAGKREKWAGTSDYSRLNEYAWYGTNIASITHQVATKLPNSLGLYDMSGNVWEWCADWFAENYYNSSVMIDPRGPSSGIYRILRGGSWGQDSGDNARCTLRNFNMPEIRNVHYGFRCARTP